jgi:dTDP-L-rhamnose 4-epimerase
VIKTILVTGGAGFIGSNLVSALVRLDYHVRVLDNLSPQIHGENPSFPEALIHDNVQFIQASVTEPSALSAAIEGCDAIVHLAAETGTGQSMYEIAHYNAVNTQATASLMELVSASKVGRPARIVLASSRSVYGEGAFRCSCTQALVFPQPRTAVALAASHWDHPCPACGRPMSAVPTLESAPLRPASVYAATKLAQEDLVRIVCEASKIDHAILRFQNVYGEGQSLTNPYTGILSIFSTRVRRGLDLPIFEDGRESRDFVHVDDVVSAIVASLRQKGPLAHTLNVGSGVATSVENVARMLALAMGEEPRIRVTGQYRLGDIRHNCADTTKLADVLCVNASVGIEVGMARFAAWTKSQPMPEDQLDRANAELRARKLMS